MSRRRQAWRARAPRGEPGARSSTTTAMATSICSWPATCRSIRRPRRSRAPRPTAGTTRSPCRAGRSASSAAPTSFIAIAATARSPMYRRRRASRGRAAPRPWCSWAPTGSPGARTGWAQRPRTSTTTGGRTSTWPATARPACSTGTTTMARSARLPCPQAWPSTRAASRWPAWASASATTMRTAGSTSCGPTSPSRCLRCTGTTAAGSRRPSIRAGLGVNRRNVGFGVGFFDFDNDGWKDIFIANGHVYAQLATRTFHITYREPKLLYRNLGTGRFEDVSAKAGDAIQAVNVGRGCAFGDFDNDGRLDVLVNNLDGPPTLLRNECHNGNAWIQIKCVGTKSNRSAIGTRVKVTAGGRSQIDEVMSGSGYYSQNDFRLHFGLGAAAGWRASKLTWPSGAKDALRDLPVNGLVVVEEGRGIVKAGSARVGCVAMRPGRRSRIGIGLRARRRGRGGTGHPVHVTSRRGRHHLHTPVFRHVEQVPDRDHGGRRGAPRLRQRRPPRRVLHERREARRSDAGGQARPTSPMRSTGTACTGRQPDGTFVDVTEKAGLTGMPQNYYGMGVAVGDYDNDGFEDLYVTELRRQHALSQQRRRHVHRRHRPRRRRRERVERERRLLRRRQRRQARSVRHALRGLDVPDEPLLRGEEARLSRVLPSRQLRGRARTSCTTTTGTARSRRLHEGRHRQPERQGPRRGSFADYDRDGFMDIYVANDSVQSFLYHNNRDGTFTEEGLVAGVGFNEDGKTFAGMGVDFADYDNDGQPDIVVTDLSNERYKLFHQNADGSFRDVTNTSGLGGLTLLFSGWSTRFVDYDNDGWKDIFVAQGHVMDTIEKTSPNLQVSAAAAAAAQRVGPLHESRAWRRLHEGLGGPRRGVRRLRQRRRHRRRGEQRRTESRRAAERRRQPAELADDPDRRYDVESRWDRLRGEGGLRFRSDPVVHRQHRRWLLVGQRQAAARRARQRRHRKARRDPLALRSRASDSRTWRHARY